MVFVVVVGGALCGGPTQYRVGVALRGIAQRNAQQGRARWVATYLFSATGRTVENHIEAYFRFADGKIIEHHDHFDLWRWMRQALGAKGLLLGWLAPVQAAVGKQAMAGLRAWQAGR